MTGLTSASLQAFLWLGSEWEPGPSLPDCVLDELAPLREAGLVEREFMDDGPPVQSVGQMELRVRLSACWHFRLTPLGQQVKAILETNHDAT